MRKKTTLSTIVLAALLAAFSVSHALAQSGSGGFTPPQPSYTPQPSNPQPPLQRVGHQEEVAVPDILSGKSQAEPAVPPQRMPPVLNQPAKATDAAMVQELPPAAAPRLASPPMRPANLPGQQLDPGVPVSPLPGAVVQPPTIPVVELGTTSEIEITQVSASDSMNRLRGQPIQSVEPQDRDVFQPTPAIAPVRDTSMATNLTLSDGPKLRVTSSGPASITIGKKARFEIQVQNLETRSANNVIVGVDLPEWVEVTAILPSTGSKELTGSLEEAMMVWQIPIVEANAMEKMVIEAIPREARPFDLDVEWTFKPIHEKTTVEVTQPQLSIQIAGPTEVQFGEKALYDVTVSNPGTGIAENVNVMLPEALGGEHAKLDNIAPQQQKKFQVELIARSAGALDLTTTVIADGDLKESDTREIIVRRAVLDVSLEGPPMKYAGSMATYQVTVSNQGDAMARDVIAAVALPPGVDFVSGIDNVEKIDGGIRWNVGMLSPGNQRTYQMNCTMAMAGEIHVDAATRGAGDLAATDSLLTRVEAVADLVLSVQDPKGPLPIGKEIQYEIKITNRGTKSARDINVVMHFSEGVEPTTADGIAYELAPGQVTFAPIAQVDPGQDVILKVMANASQPGSHRFRAQLLCEEADSHEVTEGTTRFFGEAAASTADQDDAPANDEFKR